jgi:glutaredoxin
MMSLLARWVRPRRRYDVSDLTFTVLTREQCCCCHKALDLLKELQLRHGFRLETIDVDSTPELAARHGNSVPVVVVNGRTRFKGVVNPVLLDRLLRAESAQAIRKG